MQYYQNFQLRDYNSFCLESVAKEVWFPESFIELRSLIMKLKGKDYDILGGGTNVILRPKVGKIVCLKELPKFCNFSKEGITEVSASYSTSLFVTKTIANYYKGLEGLVGIPGTIGGAVVMNAGSGEYAISDYLHKVVTTDKEGASNIYSKEQLDFSRRYSALQDKKEVIEKVIFKLERGRIKKKDYKKAVEHRRTLPREPSAGGIFKNWHTLRPHSCHIIGSRIGDAKVSRYLNIIINKGCATYEDVMFLIETIKDIVREPLELEVKII